MVTVLRRIRTTRRAWMGAVLGLLIGAAAGGDALAADKLTMAQAGTQLMRLPLYIAIQNGYLKDEGVDLEIVETRSGSDAMKMLAGNAVQLATGQLLDAILLNKQDINVVGVVMLTQRLGNSIVVRKAVADQIKSMKDLKGRTVGVTSVGSGTWQFAVFAGSLEGMKAEDFNFVGVGTGSNVVGAVKAGRIDAMSYSDPENLTMVNNGDAVFLIDMADEATHKRILGESYLNNQIMVRGDYAKANPRPIQGLVNALQRAVVWVNTHSLDETAKVLHSYPPFAGIPSDQFMVSVKRTLPQGVAKTAAISKAAFDSAMRFPVAVGALDAPMPYERLVDPSFAENAIKKYPAAK